jgi:superfamily II DNA or RNA helicase
MKVQAPDDTVWEQVLSESMRNIPPYPPEARDRGWRRFWDRLRQAPVSVRDRFIQQHRSAIHIRRRDDTWVTADDVLLPGALIEPDDTSPNQSFLVDDAVHHEDGTALAAIGVSQNPQGDIRPSFYGAGGALSEWLQACRRLYKNTHHNSASWGYLEPLSLTMPRGFVFLTQLIGRSNARLTEEYLERIAQGAFSAQIEFGHSTTRTYAKINVAHPLPWFVLRYGSVEIGNTTVRVVAVMARRNKPVLSKLPAWADWSAALERLERAFPGVHPSKGDVCDLWLAVITALATPAALADDALSDLWGTASEDGVVPPALPSSQGLLPLGDVFVTTSPDLARRMRTPERIVVTLDVPTLDLWIRRGARDLFQLLEPKWGNPVGPAQLLTAAVPELNDVLRPNVCDIARCQSVSDLRLKLGETAEPIPCLMWQGSLLLDAEGLAESSRAERLRLLLNEIAPAGWLIGTPEEALRHLGDARVDALRAEVAQGSTLAERLLRAVGKRREPLLEALGELKDLAFIQQCAPLKLAELILAQLGPATLTALKDTLVAEGLNPPTRWNTSEARAFVASIGFPAEFASAPETKRDAEETISGPIDLPRLHDFQEEVMQGFEALFASGMKRRRAVVSLPTGGGKTRVTVEAAVRLVLAPESDNRSVIWVAQTDELCEQAVQAFRQVWVNLGAPRTDLRIVRLWGGSPNPAIQAPDRPVVVVASIQTLNSRMGTEGLAWLRKPGLVVLDECHHAITLSYSNLLRWLDAETPRREAQQKDEPPIVGLSATPFRTDDDESKRLARRFDNRWLPADQEALTARLRRQGVLAQAVYEALPSGARLLDEEIEQLSRASEWEGLDFEKLLQAINRRLAGDAKRNGLLVEHIRRSNEQSILFFANSVQHAEEMSARLNLAGISAAAVSGSTPTVARRHFLDRFQRGEIRVLCNHSVLATGFDAPRTDMVLIARQLFSPVRYMQMVGRGLRGEKNGGTAHCRIVTVVDNLGRFQDRHPYHYCRQYFSAMEGTLTAGGTEL